MMAGSIGMSSTITTTTTTLLFDSHQFICLKQSSTSNASCYSTKPTSLITCSSKHHDYNIPKLEPFSRTRFERSIKDPPLIQKSESQLTDYCTVLQGEDSYSCWQAYFELKDLEKYYSKQELERLIIEAGGVKSLIGCLHGVAAIHKANKDGSETAATANKTKEEEAKEVKKVHMHIPDGIPKTAEELQEEENAKMPDSAYTRLLRLRGTHPAWYSPTPDHQTD